MIRFAVVGTASTGKSALLNALFDTRFAVDARARSTKSASRVLLDTASGPLEIIDNPPLETAALRLEADAYLLVCDKDLIDVEFDAAARIARAHRALGVAVNKADTWSRSDLRQLLGLIRYRLDGIVPADRVVPCAAEPVRIAWQHMRDGRVVERHAPSRPDLEALFPLVGELLDEADASIRVRARRVTGRSRELAAGAAATVSGWLKDKSR